MEILGIWRLKELFFADENGTRYLGRDDIEALESTEDNEDYKKLLRSDFIISENALEMYYKPKESEFEQAKNEGWEITEKGILLESYPAKIIDGQLWLDYDRTGEEYFPTEIDNEGSIIISGGIMKIEKA